MAKRRDKRLKARREKRLAEKAAGAAEAAGAEDKKKAKAVSVDPAAVATSERVRRTLLVIALLVLSFGFVLRFFHSSLILDSPAGFDRIALGRPPMASMNRLFTLVLLVAVGLWSFTFFVSREVRLLKTGALSGIFLLVFALVAWIQVPIADYTLPALNTAIDITVFALIFVFVVNISVDGRVRRFLTALVFAVCVAAAVAGLSEYGGVRADAREFVRAHSGFFSQAMVNRVMSSDMYAFFINPNVLGTVLAMGICLGAGFIAEFIRRREEGVWHKVRIAAAGVGTVVLIIALVLSRSKGGMVACGIGLLTFAVMLIISRIKKYADWYAYGLVGAMFLTLVVSVIVILKTKDPSWMGASMKVRYGYWSTAGNMIRRNELVGVGGGNYGYNFTLHKPPGADEARLVHNSYLQLWAELGAAGLLLFFLFFASIISRTLEAHERKPAERSRNLFGRTRTVILALAGGAALAVLASNFLIGPATSQTEHFGHAALIVFFLVMLPMNRLSGEAGRGEKDTGVEGYKFFFKDSWLTAGLFAAFFAFLWHNVVDFSFYSSGVMLAFIVVSALLIVSVAPQKPQNFFVRPFAGGARYVLVTVVIAAAVVLCVFTVRFIKADIWFAKAKAPSRLARLALAAPRGRAGELFRESEASLAKAVELNPSDARYHRERFLNAYARWRANPSVSAMAELRERKEELFDVNPNTATEALRYALACRDAMKRFSEEELRGLGIDRSSVVEELENAHRLYPGLADRPAAMWEFYTGLISDNPESKRIPTWKRNALDFGNQAVLCSNATPQERLKLPEDRLAGIKEWLAVHAPKTKEKDKTPEKDSGKALPKPADKKTDNQSDRAGR